MSTVAAPQTRTAPSLQGRIAAALRREAGIVRLALGVVALHVADDSFLQPEPGTSAGDHLASGLVPLAALGLVALVYPRLCAGARAAVASTLGALSIAIGVPSVYYHLDGTAAGDHWSGLAALAAGVVLLLVGPVVLRRARRPDGSRLRRLATGLAGVALVPVIAWLVVFPIAMPYVYTHTGRTPATPALGPAFEPVTVPTSDSLDLEGWYAPSRNGAAVVVYPGATRAAHAELLARHGYGVLLLEARGQGRSEGDPNRWAGDRDQLAGAAFLASRPGIDADRVGGIGFSVGGELLVEAAAQSDAFAAVVSEGAGDRVGTADVSGPARVIGAPMLAVMTAAASVFSNEGPPPPITNRIGLIAPRPVFLVYAAPGLGGEATRQPEYLAAAGEPAELWLVPGAGHTGGLEAQPEEYERRVVGFFDRALLGRR